jgi:hypothetical protein
MSQYQVPPSKASIEQNRFTFTLNGKDYSLPKLAFIKPSLVEQLEGATKLKAVRMLTDHYIPGLFDEFEDAEQLTDLYNAWATASGLKLGESSASRDSSKSTEGPSTETSSSSAEPSTTSAPTS